MKTIHITRNIYLNDDDIEYRFISASGPGGQHVNRTATAVQLRYDLEKAELPISVKTKLRKLAENRINLDGILIIEAQEFRSQHQNRQAALERLVSLIKEAAKPKKRRIPTKPTRASKERRIQNKKIQGEKKKRRRSVRPGPDLPE